jgi:hypothetical protein
MSDRFESLEGGEVVSIQHEAEVLSGQKTFKTGDLNDAIKSYVASAIPGWSEEKNDWFTDRGIDCEALRFGSKGWQKGRIRLSLEFCPDEPELPAPRASNSSIPVAPTAPKIAIESPSTPSTPLASALAEQDEDSIVLEDTISASVSVATTPTPVAVATTPTPVAVATIPDPVSVATTPTPVTAATMPEDNPPVAIPVAGIAATSAVAAAVAMAIPDLQPAASLSQAIPHHTDTILEPEHHDVDLSSPQSGGLDEILFDFDLADDRGRMIPNGIMDLEMADGLNFYEHDLLSFEANGMSDSAEGFGNFQDLDRPENSGMLIMDEVWNEMNQASWPKIS